MKLSKEDYQKKIMTATPAQLITVNFELILDYLAEAETAADNEKHRIAIDKAHGYLKLMASALDMQYELSRQLLSIYLYVNKLLITGKINQDRQVLSDAKKILSVLHKSFAAIQTDDSNWFAGLTYNSKGELDEYFEGMQRNEYRA